MDALIALQDIIWKYNLHSSSPGENQPWEEESQHNELETITRVKTPLLERQDDNK